jgi:hypothetical protein
MTEPFWQLNPGCEHALVTILRNRASLRAFSENGETFFRYE